ncbi:MAG: hypothetical protein K9J27_12200 [Bacteroidales bacterium]|nr:hypothetical protein [Bacteroidales bacterium]
MEGLEKNIEFISEKKLTEDRFQWVKKTIVKLSGVTGISKDQNVLTLSYNPYLVSETYLEKEMKKLGFIPFKEAKKKKGIVARWLDKMARANKESFGNQRLDCCELKTKQN